MRRSKSDGVLVAALHAAAEHALLEHAPTVWSCVWHGARRVGLELNAMTRLLCVRELWVAASGLQWDANSRSLTFLLLAEYVKTDSLYGYKAAQAEKHVEKLKRAFKK